MTQQLAKYTLEIAQAINRDIGVFNQNYELVSVKESPLQNSNLDIKQDGVYIALQKISDALSSSYAQIKLDIQDESRLSWAGTAHEIRQLLSTLLETLAPDDEVIEQKWYKQDSQTKGPTQKQRTHYILLKHNAGSKEQEVAENAANLDEWIGNLVRATYSRASDAAHRFKTHREVLRILRYFDAFAQDLLNLR